MTTRISATNIQSAAIVALDGPKVTAVQVANSSYAVTGGNVSASLGGYVKVTGSNFATGCQIMIDRTAATSVALVSSTELNVAVPAKVLGTYSVFIINPDGAFCTGVNAITFN